jgi:hypothetical protein
MVAAYSFEKQMESMFGETIAQLRKQKADAKREWERKDKLIEEAIGKLTELEEPPVFREARLAAQNDKPFLGTDFTESTYAGWRPSDAAYDLLSRSPESGPSEAWWIFKAIMARGWEIKGESEKLQWRTFTIGVSKHPKLKYNRETGILSIK